VGDQSRIGFENTYFMGPALFASDTYALAGQNKTYLEDWAQPGWGHDPPDDIPEDDCPDQYWSEEVEQCLYPREGSHLDMLHGSPLSAGIANLYKNQGGWVRTSDLCHVKAVR
jgi:hypothetical protein